MFTWVSYYTLTHTKTIDSKVKCLLDYMYVKLCYFSESAALKLIFIQQEETGIFLTQGDVFAYIDGNQLTSSGLPCTAPLSRACPLGQVTFLA